MRSHTVHAVIAVKSLDRAKSRLADRLPPRERAGLVLAMFTDTVRAATAVAQLSSITVVTPDPAVADRAGRLGALVHPEPMPGSGGPDDPDGLNSALRAAGDALRHRHGPVDLLALQADLPALRPGELADMLARAPRDARSVVVDHAGTGTAALLARAAVSLDPAFGPGSAHRHIAAGAVRLDGDWPGLRLDVDTAADLDRAIALGTGAATGSVLHDIGWSGRVHAPVPHVC